MAKKYKLEAANPKEIPNMYTKRELYLFTTNTYKFLRENPGNVTIKKIMDHSGGLTTIGKYLPDDKKVILDYRHPFLSVFIHEMLHHFHPDWNETKVLKEERALLNQLSNRQIRNLLKALADAI
jgi:hypothetical protein